MKAEYDLSKLNSRKNPYALRLAAEDASLIERVQNQTGLIKTEFAKRG